MREGSSNDSHSEIAEEDFTEDQSVLQKYESNNGINRINHLEISQPYKVSQSFKDPTLSKEFATNHLIKQSHSKSPT
jgi:hypothetical protein